MKFFSQNHTDPPRHKKIGEKSTSHRFHIMRTQRKNTVLGKFILHHTAHTWIHRWHRRGLLFLVCKDTLSSKEHTCY